MKNYLANNFRHFNIIHRILQIVNSRNGGHAPPFQIMRINPFLHMPIITGIRIKPAFPAY